MSLGTPKHRYFVFRQFLLQQGSQVERVHKFLSGGMVPAMRAKGRPAVVMEAISAPHMPQVALLAGMQSLEEWQKLDLDVPDLQKFMAAWGEWEAAGEPPYVSYSESLLITTPYSPEVAIPANVGLWEVRLYHAPNWRQLRALHERFSGPEIPLFHRHGIRPIVYLETMAGSHMPNLVYVTPFESLAAREAAWKGFATDPDWITARDDHRKKHGPVPDYLQISLYRAVPLG